MNHSPPYYRDLVQLKDSNAISNLDLLNAGIGDSSTKFFEFGVEDPNPYRGLQNVNPMRSNIEASIPASLESSAVRIRVPALTLPELLSMKGFCPDYIVMDIEGAELFVIEQLMHTNLRPSLLFEVHPLFIGESEVTRCLRMLGEAEYTLEQIDEHHFIAVHAKA